MMTMTPAQIDAFLSAPRHAIVGTNRADGAPQLSPVWYLYEDGQFYISTDAGTAKYKNLQRDPRISICIDGGRDDVRTVMIYGEATLHEKGHPLQQEMRWRIIRHYHEDEESAQEYIESTEELEYVLVVVRPERVISQDFR